MTAANQEVAPRDKAYFDIFVTALEGGINYWASVDTYIWTDDSGHEDVLGFHATIRDIEDDNGEFVVNRETIARGVGLFSVWASGHPSQHRHDAGNCLRFGKWDELDIDADLADEIVQFGIFGELIYG